MKIKCEIELNTDTGEYEIQFWNLSKPGQSIVYTDVLPVLKRIFDDNEKEITSGIDSDEQTLREIH